ncbi:MAG: M28 family peptidase, partial [Acetobacteraceae bacterium]|nr:M28 family peptidase [Acetobacteraceae bacterium]
GTEWPAQALGRSPAAAVPAPLLDLGRGTPADVEAAGAAVRGAIVIVRHEFMLGVGHVHRRRKYDAARAAGAAGFLIACHEPGLGPVAGSAADGGPGNIPCAGVSNEAGAALAGQSGRPVTLRISGAFADALAENLFAAVPARGEALVVLSAHMDGHDLAESAIDNASCLACALAAARAVRRAVPACERGLEVALFGIEEWALEGSRFHLAALPPAERARRVLNVNLDSVAGADGRTALTSGVPGMAEFLVAALAPAGMAVGLHAGFMGNSDHANYLRAGIPALRLCAGFGQPRSNMRVLLTRGDTRDRVALEQLRAAAEVAVALVLAACSGAVPLPPPLSAADAVRLTTV